MLIRPSVRLFLEKASFFWLLRLPACGFHPWLNASEELDGFQIATYSRLRNLVMLDPWHEKRQHRHRKRFACCFLLSFVINMTIAITWMMMMMMMIQSSFRSNRPTIQFPNHHAFCHLTTINILGPPAASTLAKDGAVLLTARHRYTAFAQLPTGCRPDHRITLVVSRNLPNGQLAMERCPLGWNGCHLIG